MDRRIMLAGGAAAIAVAAGGAWYATQGQTPTPEQVANARKVLADLQWAPFRPSSDAQLYPIRLLAINKDILKTQGDSKLSQAEKDAKIAALKEKAAKIEKLTAKVPSM